MKNSTKKSSSEPVTKKVVVVVEEEEEEEEVEAKPKSKRKVLEEEVEAKPKSKRKADSKNLPIPVTSNLPIKVKEKKKKVKPVPNVKGIVFYKKYKPMYATVEAWVRGGMTPDCYVYDGVHQLLAAGIPVSDAVEVEGRWIRIRPHLDCPPTLYNDASLLKKKKERASSIDLITHNFITSESAPKRKNIR